MGAQTSSALCSELVVMDVSGPCGFKLCNRKLLGFWLVLAIKARLWLNP